MSRFQHGCRAVSSSSVQRKARSSPLSAKPRAPPASAKPHTYQLPLQSRGDPRRARVGRPPRILRERQGPGNPRWGPPSGTCGNAGLLGGMSATEEPLSRSHAARHEATQPQQRGGEQGGRQGGARPHSPPPWHPPLPSRTWRQRWAGPARGRTAGEAGGRSAALGAAAGSERRFANGATPISTVSAFYYYI